MVQGQVFLNGGGGGGGEEQCWHFPYLIFSRFIIFTFTNFFTLFLCKIVLCIEEKLFFTANKVILR